MNIVEKNMKSINKKIVVKASNIQPKNVSCCYHV